MDQAEDLAQEVAIRLIRWPSRQGYRPGPLLHIFSQQCMREIARSSPMWLLLVEEDLEEEQVDRDFLLSEIVKQALEVLPAPERVVLVACDRDGGSSGELARQLGLTAAHVDVLRFRARATLRRIISGRISLKDNS